jgi:hypothetical protein
VDGYQIKDELKKFTTISRKSLDDGNQFWGRILGTKYETTQLLTSYPIDETVAAPPEDITADAVSLGVDSNADLIGRDLKGKAAIVYSCFVPGAAIRTGAF